MGKQIRNKKWNYGKETTYHMTYGLGVHRPYRMTPRPTRKMDDKIAQRYRRREEAKYRARKHKMSWKMLSNRAYFASKEKAMKIGAQIAKNKADAKVRLAATRLRQQIARNKAAAQKRLAVTRAKQQEMRDAEIRRAALRKAQRERNKARDLQLAKEEAYWAKRKAEEQRKKQPNKNVMFPGGVKPSLQRPYYKGFGDYRLTSGRNSRLLARARNDIHSFPYIGKRYKKCFLHVAFRAKSKIASVLRIRPSSVDSLLDEWTQNLTEDQAAVLQRFQGNIGRYFMFIYRLGPQIYSRELSKLMKLGAVEYFQQAKNSTALIAIKEQTSKEWFAAASAIAEIVIDLSWMPALEAIDQVFEQAVIKQIEGIPGMGMAAAGAYYIGKYGAFPVVKEAFKGLVSMAISAQAPSEELQEVVSGKSGG